MRTAVVFVVIASWFLGTAQAQAPPPGAVARCRAMDLAAQFTCFNALNKKMKQVAEPGPAAPTVPTAPSLSPSAPAASAAPSPTPVSPSGAVAAEGVPVCASLSNPQKRLSCYDAKFPPPTPAPGLPISN
jgi:hypothetical protein